MRKEGNANSEKERGKLYKEQRSYHISKEKFNKKSNKNENYCKVQDHCHHLRKCWGLRIVSVI